MTSDPTGQQPLLKMAGIDKSFPGVRALRDVSLELHKGEVLALLGENGAGKSTLIKILGGAHQPDEGTLIFDGQQVTIPNPMAAQQLGISIIYQEFNLIPDLTVRENIFLGREKTRYGLVASAEEYRQSKELFQKIGLEIDPGAKCRDLTVAQQQTVEIAKALSIDAKLIVMDEPTAALTNQEVDRLFVIIDDLKAHGIGVIYISHRLEEIFRVADRLMVLRDGVHVGSRQADQLSRDELIEMMVGRPLDAEFPKHAAHPAQERLRVEKLNRGTVVRDVSFSVRAGEVLGFAGLIGAGRSETMRIVFGADKGDSGRIFIDGIAVRIKNPRDAIANRICLLTEDRKGQGLVLIHSVLDNFSLPNWDRFQRGFLLSQSRARKEFAVITDRLKIRLTSPDQLAMNLSGGNQQKVVLAKWLAQNADIVIFDEPTRGIDVGSKYEIHLLMNELAAQGKAIIMISSELPEVLGMSDRILVMHEGQVKGEITDVANTTQEEILSLAMA